MIEIKKEKYYKIGVKCGTRQKLIRTIEQWKGDMIWCLRIFFLLSFSCVKITFQFQPIGVIFPFFFMCQTQSPCTWKFRWSQGGQVPPLTPLWLHHCIISTKFYFYLPYFQQKIFSFGKISESQTDPKYPFGKN